LPLVFHMHSSACLSSCVYECALSPYDVRKLKLWGCMLHAAAVISGVTKGGQGDLPPGAAYWGRTIEVGMLHNNYKMSNASACCYRRIVRGPCPPNF